MRAALFLFLIASVQCLGQIYTITTVAGSVPTMTTGPWSPLGDGGPATSATLVSPIALAMDSSRNLYIADPGVNRVRRVSPAGIITTFAGIGDFTLECKVCAGYSGDGGPANKAALNQPGGLAVDSSGNIYIADRGNCVIRKVTVDGIISTFAGTGKPGYSGDGGPALNAQFTPSSVAIDSAGSLYISDSDASVVRRIAPNGTVSTFAGNGVKGWTGDGGAAPRASLVNPSGVAFDRAGNAYIADDGSSLVRRVGADGNISTVATGRQLQSPYSVAVDSFDNLFIADQVADQVIEVPAGGPPVTAAGNGIYIFQGDGGLASNAGLSSPAYVLASGANVYVAESGGRVRLLTSGAPPGGPVPAVSKGGIVPIFSSAQSIQAGSWISIYGNNLTSSAQPVIWNGEYPLALGGTTVTFSRMSSSGLVVSAAALSYVSPTLINALVPLQAASGSPVTVTITDANGTGTASVTFGLASPAFCLLGDEKHVAGIILRQNGTGAYGNGSYDVIGPAGNSLGYPTVPAKGGDSIVLFGVGFGPTTPEETVPLSGITKADFPVPITIGSTQVQPSFEGLSSPGVFQFNLTLPTGLGSGDRPLTAGALGLSTQSNVVIAVQ